jgi:hypothetical protein
MNQEPLFGLKLSQLAIWISEGLRTFSKTRYKLDSNESLPLSSELSPYFQNLNWIQGGSGTKIGKGLMVGTVRMGYGHHRMAMAAYSHSIKNGTNTYLHDLLGIESKEADAIKDIDSFYSYFSRLSSEVGGVVDYIWGQFTSSGNLQSLYVSTLMAEEYKNLLKDSPIDNPYVSTYPLNGQIAVACGYTNVVQMICDNFPQYYLLVPGAMNLVQTDSAYKRYIEMGVPKENLMVAGHWVSEDIRSNIEKDSTARVRRSDSKEPKRFLIPVGGAGAQKSFLGEFVTLSKSRLLEGECHYFINSGDHAHVHEFLVAELEKKGIPFEAITDTDSLKDFIAKRKLDDTNPVKTKPVTLFHFKSHFEAFSATEYLIRISDVLVTKPSELAFYPIPKLFIKRVGDHEQYSALYSKELGEGTLECRETSTAFETMQLFIGEDQGIFLRMNECIQKHNSNKIYDGAKVAIDYASKK